MAVVNIIGASAFALAGVWFLDVVRRDFNMGNISSFGELLFVLIFPLALFVCAVVIVTLL